VLTIDQLRPLFDTLDPPHRVIAQLCYYCAARINEIVRLQATDIKADAIAVPVSKKKGKVITKHIPLSPAIAQALKAANLPQTGYLFPTGNRRKNRNKIFKRNREGIYQVVGTREMRPHISTQAVYKAVTQAAQTLGYSDVGTHTFRRSMATRLEREGVPLRQIMRITGHSDLASLTAYLAVEEAIASENYLKVVGND
jgi:integrase/recombinase XerD